MKEDALVVSLGDLPQLTRLSIGGMLPFVVQQYLPRWRQLQDLKLVITNAVYDEYDDQHAYALQDFVPLAALTRLTRFVTEVHDELWDEQYSPNDVPPLIITNKVGARATTVSVFNLWICRLFSTELLGQAGVVCRVQAPQCHSCRSVWNTASPKHGSLSA